MSDRDLLMRLWCLKPSLQLRPITLESSMIRRPHLSQVFRSNFRIFVHGFEDEYDGLRGEGSSITSCCNANVVCERRDQTIIEKYWGNQVVLFNPTGM